MGYVGLTLALKLTTRDFTVLGVESDPDRLSELRQKRAFCEEPDIDVLLSQAIEADQLKLVAPNEVESGVYFDAVFVTVGTPVVSGNIDFSFLSSAVSTIVKLVGPKSIIVLRSTVAVGTASQFETMIRESLASGQDFLGVCFAPERTIEGAALEELGTLPQIVGADSEEVKMVASKLFAATGVEVVTLDCAKSAELAKLISNCYRDFHFSIANLFNYIAEGMNLRGSQIIDAVNYGYPRGGIPRPGPVAGPCLEKDAYILASCIPDTLGRERDLILSLRQNNELIVEKIAGKTLEVLGNSPARVAVCGIAFKGRPATNDTRGSIAIPIISTLQSRYSLILQDYEFQGQLSVDGTTYKVVSEIPDACDLYLYLNNHHMYGYVTKRKYIDVWE